ncbi:phospholipase [Paraglaciecola arctica]|uniref:phospholipase n=1 Tax=Paraglaciecola arctica TaxID=1128911 RepID=UPI001C06A7F4|nr:phospholipase [Paraglaciecola arctica]MBU3002139.1 phospholipase [Paraglaciecola arctica]
MRLCIFLSLFFSTILLAKDFNNGCGSGWNEPLVPERVGLMCVNFSSACAAHDNCYSNCLEGGKNYNKPICKLTATEQKEQRRAVCDSDFLDTMNAGCDRCNFASKPLCKGVALLYKFAVKMGGKGSFNGKTVPEDYYAFLNSERAKDFDFSAFEKEITDILQQPNIVESNRLEFLVRDGAPVAKFVGLNVLTLKKVKVTEQITLLNKVKYGNVDLSDAAKGQVQIGIKDLNIEKLDASKLQNIQTVLKANRSINL